MSHPTPSVSRCEASSEGTRMSRTSEEKIPLFITSAFLTLREPGCFGCWNTNSLQKARKERREDGEEPEIRDAGRRYDRTGRKKINRDNENTREKTENARQVAKYRESETIKNYDLSNRVLVQWQGKQKWGWFMCFSTLPGMIHKQKQSTGTCCHSTDDQWNHSF